MTPSGVDFLFPFFLRTVNCIHVAAYYSMRMCVGAEAAIDLAHRACSGCTGC